MIESSILTNNPIILPQTEPYYQEWLGSQVSSGIVDQNVTYLDNPHDIYSALLYSKDLGQEGNRYTSKATRNAIAKYEGTVDQGGWMVQGIDPLNDYEPMEWIRFKPDTPRPDPKKPDEKIVKYESPPGAGARAIFLDVPEAEWRKICEVNGIPFPEGYNGNVWKWIEENPSIPIVLEEGEKKAGATLTAGMVAIALPGINSGYRRTGNESYQAIPELEHFAHPERQWIINFDNESTNKINNAIVKQAQCLLKLPCAGVAVCEKGGDTKGTDDFIAAHGVEAFLSRLDASIDFEEWSKSKESKGKVPLPPASAIARELAEKYRVNLAWNDEAQSWYRYEAETPGVWSPESPTFVQAIIQAHLDCQPGNPGYSLNLVKSVAGLLKGYLAVRNWREQDGLLPFLNGCLNLETRELLPHSPGYRFTWSLPRQYNILATDWSVIDAWMDEVTDGNGQLKNVLLCWLNACLKGRADLQRFLHLTGPGGSGKGTFMRLCINLIGRRNNYSSTLSEWCTNRFESYNAYGKRLITFPDEDKFSGGLSKFKSLVGQDFIRAEAKGKQGFQFQFGGMVMLSSNFPIFAGDSSSGMARRALVVPFHHAVKAGQRRDLETEFEPELAALTNYVLAIPDETVTATLLQLEASPEVLSQTWEYRVRSDSITAWLNEHVIHDPFAFSTVGNDKTQKETLFGSYWNFCDRTGSRAKGSREFSPSLIDLCQSILGWEDVERKRLGGIGTRGIAGLRLRTAADADVPFLLESLVHESEAMSTNTVTGEGDVTGQSNPVTGTCDGSEALLSESCDGCDGLDFYPAHEAEKEKTFLPVTEPLEKVFSNGSDRKGNTPSPVTPVTTGAGKDIEPVTAPVTPPVTGQDLPVTTYEAYLVDAEGIGAWAPDFEYLGETDSGVKYSPLSRTLCPVVRVRRRGKTQLLAADCVRRVADG